MAAQSALIGSSARKRPKVMKQCGEQWQAAKAAGTTNGETCPEFLKECRARLASRTTAPGRFRQLLRRPRPRLLRQRRRNRAHCSGGNSLQRQPRPLRPQPTARRLQPEPVNSPQCRKLNTAAPERRWFGSTSARTFALCGNSRLRQHEAGRLHVRGRRPGCRQSRGEERPPSVRKSLSSKCAAGPPRVRKIGRKERVLTVAN